MVEEKSLFPLQAKFTYSFSPSSRLKRTIKEKVLSRVIGAGEAVETDSNAVFPIAFVL